MAVVRTTVRQNLATLLRTAVFAGLLDGSGNPVKCFQSVYESIPDEVVDEDIPTCLINIGDDTERRLTDPVGSGIKELSFDIVLEIFAWVDTDDDILGTRMLDNILDGVSTVLRASPNTISGAVALAYDDVSTKTHPPVVSAGDNGEPAGKVLLHATRRFRAFAFDAG